MITNRSTDRLLALVPLIPPYILLVLLSDNPLPILVGWLQHFLSPRKDSTTEAPPVGSQLLAYVTLACFGFLATNRLVPHIKQYTLRKGISGRDLGKRGTSIADKEM